MQIKSEASTKKVIYQGQTIIYRKEYIWMHWRQAKASFLYVNGEWTRTIL